MRSAHAGFPENPFVISRRARLEFFIVAGLP
jgi:hypothetical protein